MICSKCGAEKVPYEFPVLYHQPLICFDCLGPHECIQCGQFKHALEFRVMGKICAPCKIASGMHLSAEQIKRYETLTGGLISSDHRPANRHKIDLKG